MKKREEILSKNEFELFRRIHTCLKLGNDLNIKNSNKISIILDKKEVEIIEKLNKNKIVFTYWIKEDKITENKFPITLFCEDIKLIENLLTEYLENLGGI